MSADHQNAFDAEAVRDFIEREAALLDEGRLDDWLNLYAPDAHYWVPLLGSRQVDPRSHNSIAYEDSLLLRLRVERLKHPRAHSQHPPSQCQHVLQRPLVELLDAIAGTATVRTPFIYIEARGEDQLVLAGRYVHALKCTPAGIRIQLKRVDLLASERPLPAVQLFI